MVSRIEIDGRDWLFYRAFPVHVGLIRGTAVDIHGNILMDEEAIIGEVLAIAQAVHNCGGTVIAQVQRVLSHAAPPMSVRVPGVLIDRVVVATAEQHDQTFAERDNPAYYRAAERDGLGKWPHLPAGHRRIIASRACDELKPGAIANLGIGTPEGVSLIAAERGLLGEVTLTVESGPIGGVPAGGLSFGASFHPQAIIDQPAQFDFYDGGGLDFAALGAAEIDRRGNVNVSRFGERLVGVGGFVNISQKRATGGLLQHSDFRRARSRGRAGTIADRPRRPGPQVRRRRVATVVRRRRRPAEGPGGDLHHRAGCVPARGRGP